MNIWQIYKELTSVHWEIGFLDNTLEGIVNGEELRLTLVTHDYPDSWFADPFILDVTDDTIVVLVEEVTKKIQKGRITKLVIDRRTNHVVEKKIILERPGHLSFPIIYRLNDKVYIYPENSADGSLNIYEYSFQNDSVTLIHELSDRPLTDAVFTDLFGKSQLFTTEADYANGFQLDQYEWDCEKKKFVFVTSSIFSEHIARMAGYFFTVNGKVYRPAQESNTNYGHGISLQETSFNNGKWEFKEVRRMVSPHPKLTRSFHTLNSYKGVIVVDVLGKRYPIANRVISFLLAPIKKLKNKR